MHRALAIKELRETGWLALVALLLHATCFGPAMGISMFPLVGSTSGRMPFVADGLSMSFVMVSGLLAVALGFRQAVWESVMGTDKFLLHRPISRTRLVGTKLLTGCSLLLVCSALPILLYGWWAATPGNHAGPFEWSMTFPFWKVCAVMSMVYLASFLSGIRPGRWYGSRLLPLVGTGAVAMVFSMAPWLSDLEFLLIGAADGLLVGVIMLVARTRDY